MFLKPRDLSPSFVFFVGFLLIGFLGVTGCKSRSFPAQLKAQTSQKSSQKAAKDIQVERDLLYPDSKDFWQDKTMTQIESDRETVDAKYTKAQVCQDYELAIHALALLQAPVGRSGNNMSAEKYAELLSSCPGTYSATVKKILDLQRSLRDFHTGLDEYQLIRTKLPVVSKCETADVCGEIIGSSLIPLLTEQGVRAYASFFDTKGNQKVLRILEVNGRSDSFLFNEMVANSAQSNSLYGSLGALSLELFLKKTIDLPLPEMNLKVFDFSAQTVGKMTVSFEKKREIPIPDVMLNEDLIGQFNTPRHYDCTKFISDVSKEIGACEIEDNRAVAWVASFDVDNVYYKVMNGFRKMVRQLKIDRSRPLILDLRGNTGGSPELAGVLACTLGGPEVAQRISQRELRPSLWPREFVLLDGTRLSSKDLVSYGNGDLIRIDEGFVADSKNPDPTRKEYGIGFFERFSQGGILTGESRCKEFSTSEMQGLQWYVLTSGQEFSATENFLSFIAQDNSRFRIIGSRSRGGTGAPFYLEFPNTPMVLRLSQARHVDKVTGEWPIEAVGVPVDVMSLADRQADFEKRVMQSLSRPDGGRAILVRPLVLTKALALPSFGADPKPNLGSTSSQ